jgi:FixJ family two-component response regulator
MRHAQSIADSGNVPAASICVACRPHQSRIDPRAAPASGRGGSTSAAEDHAAFDQPLGAFTQHQAGLIASTRGEDAAPGQSAQPKGSVHSDQRRIQTTPSTMQSHAMNMDKSSRDSEPPIVYVVDDDARIRDMIREVLEENGRLVEDYSTCEAFLDTYRPRRGACLIIDAFLPGMSGLELLRILNDLEPVLPAIMITGYGDVPMAVQAIKAGASNFLEKPIGRTELLSSVERALKESRTSDGGFPRDADVPKLSMNLTSRQQQIMELVLAGHPSNYIARQLEISQRTVENHRAAIMKKTGAKSLPGLVSLALMAGWNIDDGEVT